MPTPPDNPIDAVQLKRDTQARMHEETRGMSVEERIAYYRQGAEEFRRQLKEDSAGDPPRFRGGARRHRPAAAVGLTAGGARSPATSIMLARHPPSPRPEASRKAAA